MVSMLTPTVDVNWLPDVTSETISDVQRDYRRNRSLAHDNGEFASDVTAELVDDLHDDST